MKKKIDEIKQCLDLKLYNSALALVLTLPSVCARVEYGNAIVGDKAKYVNWFNKYAKDKFTFEAVRIPGDNLVEFNTIDGNTCYKLRCAVLHAGNYEVDECKYTKITIHGHDQNSEIYEHEYTDSGEFHMDINVFCKLLCLAIEEYYEYHEDKSKFNVDNVMVLDW